MKIPAFIAISLLAAPAVAQTQVGAAGIGPLYHFTNAPATAEEAYVTRDMGATVHKFALTPPSGTTLLQQWQNDPATVQIAATGFETLVFWALPFHPLYTDPTAPAYSQQNYDELFALAAYLRTVYQGSGKRFFLGNWEGDNMLTLSGTKAATPTGIANFTAWVNTRQNAIDDAKAATPNSDVEVWHYIELNFVRPSPSASATILSAILPVSNPDFVSYSAWQSLWPNQAQLAPDLQTISNALKPKSSVPGQRVFLGEFGAKASYWGPAKQASNAQQVLDIARAAGVPFALYWAVYDNTGQGYQIVDKAGVIQPVAKVLFP